MVDWNGLFAARAHGMKASDIRDAFKLAEQSDIISFAGGFPGIESFPAKTVADISYRVAADDSGLALQYGPTEGFADLRGWIAGYLSRQGVACKPQEIVLTNGSQQALDLLCKLFIDSSDVAGVELPGYIGGLAAINNYGAQTLGVPLDSNGMQTIWLEQELSRREREGLEGIKLLYVVPNFQNPTGVTLSLERRKHLVELAQRHDFVIIEDNPYGELRFEGTSLPAIKSFDRDGRVFYLGSFSKTFIPGIRLGWLVAPDPVVQKVIVAKQGTDLCTNSWGQRVVFDYVTRYDWDRHKAGLIDLYRQKRDTMIGAMEEHFPAGVTWTQPEGGFFCWVTLPETVDAKILLPDAVKEERVAYVGGQPFHVDGGGKNTLRLAYSQMSIAAIEEGIRRLGRIFTRRVGTNRRVETVRT